MFDIIDRKSQPIQRKIIRQKTKAFRTMISILFWAEIGKYPFALKALKYQAATSLRPLFEKVDNLLLLALKGVKYP